MYKQTKKAWLTTCLAFGLLFCFVSQDSWAKSPASLAAELARLRSEVEALSSRLEERKEQVRTQLRTLSMQKSSLTLRLQKASLQLKQLKKRKEALQKKIQASGKTGEALRPVVQKSAKQIKILLKQGLPFRVKERIAALDKITQQLKAKLLTPRVAASRLWQFVESEIRLSRENGMYSQVIELNGKRQLVQIARLGMVMLFFQTRDVRYGKAVFTGGKWQYVFFKDKKEISQVAKLFDALKKQIRVGFWTIPSAIKGKSK